MNLQSWLAALGVAFCLMAPPAFAGPWGDGIAAYKRGDGETAVRLFQSLAVEGNALAQLVLGWMYAHGDGVPQDYAKAMKWLRLAADQGLASAQYMVGKLYYEGKGVPQDFVQAHMWFNLAASSGGADAAKGRDIVARVMTPDQIAEAQRLAREWWTAHPKQ